MKPAASLRLRLGCRFEAAQGAESADLLFQLLEGVRADGALAGAARRAGVSYRYAWGLVGTWEKRLGQPLLVRSRGRGAGLTPYGVRLLLGQHRVESRLAPMLHSLEAEFAAAMREAGPASRPVLRLTASHDLALPRLRELAEHSPEVLLDLRFAGSEDSLRALAEERCDLAGFHCALSMGRGSLAHLRYRRWLRPREQRLIRFVARRQGLILRREDAARVGSLADVANLKLRFINRQRGSGSRLLVEQLMAEARLQPRDLPGYQDEEHTHIGVAAAIAAGSADLGVGIEAAASRYGLHFIPLVFEDYLLLAGEALLDTPALQALLQLLRSRSFRAAAAALPGYAAENAGDVLALEAGLPWMASREPQVRVAAPPSPRARSASSSSA